MIGLAMFLWNGHHDHKRERIAALAPYLKDFDGQSNKSNNKILGLVLLFYLFVQPKMRDELHHLFAQSISLPVVSKLTLHPNRASHALSGGIPRALPRTAAMPRRAVSSSSADPGRRPGLQACHQER